MSKTDNNELFKSRRDQERSLDGVLEEGVIGATISLWENIAHLIYRRFDRFLARRDININDDNGFMINSMWYLIHGFQKFPRFLKTLKTKDKFNIGDLATSVLNYFRNKENIGEGDINGIRYMAINIPKGIHTIEDVARLCQENGYRIKLAISNCAKGHLLYDQPETMKISDYGVERTSPSRSEDHVKVCPLRLEDYCTYNSPVGEHEVYQKTCCETPCRTGEIAELLNKNGNSRIEMTTTLSSFAVLQNGFGDGIIQRTDNELYLIEVCASTGRHLETIGRMYPNFKAMVFFYDAATSCRIFNDRWIRKRDYRDRIIADFIDDEMHAANPIYDVVERIAELNKGNNNAPKGI